ncbi:MAG: deoxyribodipyrimidine photo-lyase [Phycisphaerae bacterium]|nr:deoxyribodipyrimidine photo-lyase [Gemmatimonadaceae bacterium]
MQRSVDVNGKRHNPDGEYVLYWMQSTHRLDENWALRAAVRAADKIGRPLVVHQGLDPTYPHAADRHHTFMLQGARDTAQRAEETGIHYQFVLRERRTDDRRVVDRLASRAYLVVTDLFPTAGIRERTARFAERVGCRVLAVDSSCTVPSGIFSGAEYAARTIRPKLAKLLDHAIEPVEDCAPQLALPESLVRSLADTTECATLPIATMEDDAIAAAVARTEIDHGVGAVVDRPGGSVAAALLLQNFVVEHLPAYSEQRGDSSMEESTSGLSPYLHVGQISSAAVVRAARESGSPAGSVDAFVQQATTWRELSFNWCIRTPEFDQLSALPEWIQKTMRAHVDDARPQLYDLATLERGETHDEFWNAAQRQLLATGTIHNYARMLWGKTLLLWTPDYETARARMFYLNDKYALDGRDPNSVGGIMWCLGLWDRPWGNKPIWGGIRPMVTSRVRLKFDTARYIARWTGAGQLL